MNLNIQQEQINRGVRNLVHQQTAAMVDSQGIQPPVNYDGQKGMQSTQIQQRTDNPHKNSEIYQQQQQIDSTNTRNTNSRTTTIQQTQNRQNIGSSSELLDQGNITINTTNYDSNVQTLVD